MKTSTSTTSSRGKTSKRVDLKTITKKEPEKSLTLPLKKKAGRNFQGRVTVRHRGGGAKRLYRIINFGQEKINIPGKVTALEYDPNRTAFIALVEYQDGTKGYILAPQGIQIGDEIITAESAEIKPGNRIKLKNIPVGTEVYNIEIQPGSRGRLVRSAGTSAKILAHEGGYTHLQMPSTEIRKINSECFATIGAVSHPEHRFVEVKKAGRSRLKGKRPHVRGSAMNPVDHPHGGGEGKAGIGMPHPKTPWGKPALGVKTRKRKHTDKFILKRRKKRK
jgi:large subunit ribosomal protein L2